MADDDEQPENGPLLKLIKISEGEDNDQMVKRRTVIMKTGVVCISNSQAPPLDRQKYSKIPVEDLLDHKHPDSDKSTKMISSGSEAMCPVCHNIFFSKKAMYGHMRCHPERQWRGINPPPPPSAATKTDSPSSSSAVKSSVVAPCTILYCQLPKGWLVTGRRGQNHPLSLSGTRVDDDDDGRGRRTLILKEKGFAGAEPGRKEAGHGDNIQEESDDKMIGTINGRKAAPAPALREYKYSTCDKVFGTFQALGGHRSSHSYKNKLEVMDSTTTTTTTGEKESKVMMVEDRFKCNICSKRFMSGQALGGHKRIHFQGSSQATPSSQAGSVSEEAAARSLVGKVLDFDLNSLPPMED